MYSQEILDFLYGCVYLIAIRIYEFKIPSEFVIYKTYILFIYFADTAGVINIKDITGVRQSLETSAEGTAQRYAYLEDYQGVAKEVEIATSENSNDLPDINAPKRTLPEVHAPLRLHQDLSTNPTTSFKDNVHDQSATNYAIKTEIPGETVPKGSSKAYVNENPHHNNFNNLGCSYTLTSQESTPAPLYVPIGTHDILSLNKGDPSLRQILDRQVDLAEKQENLLKSCNEAMDQQKQMFERMGKILKEVSLTQEKTSTSKQNIFYSCNNK